VEHGNPYTCLLKVGPSFLIAKAHQKISFLSVSYLPIHHTFARGKKHKPLGPKMLPTVSKISVVSH
jgi:hypothetical protein